MGSVPELRVVENVDAHFRIPRQANDDPRPIGLVTAIRIGAEMGYEVEFKISFARSLNVARRNVEDS